MTTLAIDFGGTRIRAGWFDSDLHLLSRAEAPTEAWRPRDQVIQTIIDTGRRVVPEGLTPDRIGIAAPGPLDAARGVIFHAFTLPGWDETPLGSIISGAFGGAPVYMQNDANLAALAEYEFGAGQGCDPLIYLTLSTGIGGGAVIGGRLFSGWQGMAIEPGHMRFVLPDSEGLQKVYRWEELCSGTGIAERARRWLNEHPDPSILRSLTALDTRAIGEACIQGDRVAQGFASDASYWLGLGLVNLMHLFNPRAIVLGGSVVNLGSALLDPARAIVEREALHSAFVADDLIRTAALGDDVCLYGAAYYASSAGG